MVQDKIVYETKERGFSWDQTPHIVPAEQISKDKFEHGKKYFPDDYRSRKIGKVLRIVKKEVKEYTNPDESPEERRLGQLIATHIMGWTLNPENIEAVKRVAIEFSNPEPEESQKELWDDAQKRVHEFIVQEHAAGRATGRITEFEFLQKYFTIQRKK